MERVKWHLAIQAGDRFAILIGQLQQFFAARWCGIQGYRQLAVQQRLRDGAQIVITGLDALDGVLVQHMLSDTARALYHRIEQHAHIGDLLTHCRVLSQHRIHIGHDHVEPTKVGSAHGVGGFNQPCGVVVRQLSLDLELGHIVRHIGKGVVLQLHQLKTARDGLNLPQLLAQQGRAQSHITQPR